MNPEKDTAPAGRVQQLVDEFCEAFLSGVRPDPEKFCADHPECGPELRERIESFLLVADDEDAGCAGEPPRRAADPEKDAPLAGRVLGDFRILREIGRGAMGVVYEAEQASLGRRVALKVLAAHLRPSADAVKKFEREAMAAACQNHPGIAAVYSVDAHNGVPYIAQELVVGGSLADRIAALREGGDRPPEYFRRSARLIAEVAEALDHAHAKGVIHRDVKPENILLTPEGRPKLTDFGLSKVAGAPSLSASGGVAGTPVYMSPEQAAGRRHGLIDRRTDIYSLGATLYELLTLKRAVDGETTQEVLRKVVFADPKDPRKIDPRVPRDLVVICLKALEKNPSHRYQTMAELAADLRRFCAGEAIVAAPVGRLRAFVRRAARTRVSPLAAAAAGAVLTAAVISMIAFVQREDAALKFKPVDEALDWKDGRSIEHPWNWCHNIDPSHPAGRWLEAIVYAEGRDVDRAIKAMAGLPDLHRLRGEAGLAADACYLLARLKLLAAEDPANEALRDALLAEAQAMIGQAGKPGGHELVWREDWRRDSGDETVRWFRKPIRLNAAHRLCGLSKGLSLLDVMFRGGSYLDFERAKAYLEAARTSEPGDIIAATCVARLDYLWARLYDRLDLLLEARKLLETEVLPKDPQTHLPYTTLGQICLCIGDFGAAEQAFQEALTYETGATVQHLQNAHRGRGIAFALAGRFDEADQSFTTARAAPGGYYDVQTLDAMADLCLVASAEGDARLEDAKRWIERACVAPHAEQRSRSSYTFYIDIAAAYVTRAFVYARAGDPGEVLNSVTPLAHERVQVAPYDFSLACLLAGALLEDPPPGCDRGICGELEDCAEVLSSLAGYQVKGKVPSSPICHSARGAVRCMQGRFEEATECFAAAMADRQRFWAEPLRRYHRYEDVIDLYFTALAHHALALRDPSGAAHAQAARDAKNRAGALAATLEHVPFKERWLIARLRDAAEKKIG